MLTQMFECRSAPPEAADPATPENRRALARKLLLGSIRRYEEASAEWAAVYESYPKLDPPRAPAGPEEVEERWRWKELLEQADENFDNAERNLAERIERLFAVLDPAGRCGPRVVADYFTPRAVAHAGTVYVLAYSPDEYEPKTNIIAAYRESVVVDLAEVQADSRI